MGWEDERDEAIEVAGQIKQVGGVAMVNHNDLVVQVAEAVGRNDELRELLDALVQEFRTMEEDGAEIGQLSTIDLAASVVLGVTTDMCDALQVALVWSVHAPTNTHGQGMLNVVVDRMRTGDGVAVDAFRKALVGMQTARVQRRMRGMLNDSKLRQQDKGGDR